MKIIHCADLHLDSKMESNLTKEQATERKQELIMAFNNMINYAKNNNISLIMIAGDMFDTPKAQQKRIKQRAFEIMKENHDIDFIYLSGNHDEDMEFEELCALRGENMPENIKVLGDEWTTYKYGRVAITGCKLKACNENSLYERLVLDEKDINIVMMHGLLVPGITISHEDDIPLRKLQNKNIDYLALGHIHEYACERLDNRGRYVYSGCLEGRGFDECGDKGFVVVEIDENTGKIDHTFIENSIRRCHEINIELNGDVSETEIKNEVAKSVRNISSQDLVKIVFRGEVGEETIIECDYIKRLFADNFYFLKVYDGTKLLIDYNSFANDVSLKGEFIRCVQAAGYDEETANKIIVAGIRALAGRDI